MQRKNKGISTEHCKGLYAYSVSLRNQRSYGVDVWAASIFAMILCVIGSMKSSDIVIEIIQSG